MRRTPIALLFDGYGWCGLIELCRDASRFATAEPNAAPRTAFLAQRVPWEELAGPALGELVTLYRPLITVLHLGNSTLKADIPGCQLGCHRLPKRHFPSETASLSDPAGIRTRTHWESHMA
jgi:hypothetical protein